MKNERFACLWHNELKYIIDNQLNASKTELNYPLFFHPISDEKEYVIFENDKIKD